MTPIARRQLLIGAAAAGTAGLAFAAEPRRVVEDFGAQRLGALVPMTAGAWIGSDDAGIVPESVDASPLLGQTISRSYVSADRAPVMAVISYHGPDSPELKVHRPETCYTVAGFQVSEPRPIGFDLLPNLVVPAVTFESRRGDRAETVIYWTRVGSEFPQSLFDQRVSFLSQAVRGVRADGLLARLSVIAEPNPPARRRLGEFARALFLASPARSRALLLGPRGAGLLSGAAPSSSRAAPIQAIL